MFSSFPFRARVEVDVTSNMFGMRFSGYRSVKASKLRSEMVHAKIILNLFLSTPFGQPEQH